jgi:hypothetical protein
MAVRVLNLTIEAQIGVYLTRLFKLVELIDKSAFYLCLLLTHSGKLPLQARSTFVKFYEL